jgi:hypothetical protein
MGTERIDGLHIRHLCEHVSQTKTVEFGELLSEMEHGLRSNIDFGSEFKSFMSKTDSQWLQ